jgi:hypothetical protein
LPIIPAARSLSITQETPVEAFMVISRVLAGFDPVRLEQGTDASIKIIFAL